MEIEVRENGAADMTVETTTWGCGVGAFRKLYSEILPEERQRRYQSILGAIAQAATATGDLETDIESYPAKRRFSCLVPDFAVVSGKTMTLQLPALLSSIPTFAGKSRKTPFAVGGASDETQVVTVRFPEGYVNPEHMPESFSFSDPVDPKTPWLECRVTHGVKDGRYEVRIERIVRRRRSSWYGANYIELVRDWNRITKSRANRSISVSR